MADAAAVEAIRYFRKPTALDDKSTDPGHTGPQKDFDPVTAADRGAERAIRDEIAARFGDHGIHGEEFGLHNPEANYRWIIDPIDGTTAFIMGWPMWGTLIGLTHDTTPILGVMDQPFTRERFWSTETGAVSRGPEGNETALKTRTCATLSDAILTTTHPDFFSSTAQNDAFLRIKRSTKTTRYGGDCYAYAMLASGFTDLIVESGLNAYDIAALIPIVEKAGGVITTWTGEPATSGGDIVAAGDPRIHQAAVELLNHNNNN